MQRLGIISIVVYSCIFCACGNGGKDYTVHEPEDYLAITDTIAFESHHVSMASLVPVRMIVSKNHLVIARAKEEHVFCIHELPLGGKVFSGVFRGRGPTELIEPDFKSLVPEGDGFIIADSDNLFKSYAIKGNEVVMDGGQRFFDTNVLNGVIKAGTTILNVNLDERENHPFEFVAMKKNGSKDFIGQIPEWDKSVPKDDKTNFVTYANMHVARPSGDRIAEFYCFFRKVRIIDLQGKILSETSVNYPTPSSRVPVSEGIYCTYGIPPCASNQIIVALAENTFRLGGPAGSPRKDHSEFQIWDWKGHLLRRVILKRKIDVFTVDFVTGTLYGMDQDKEDVIYTADISRYISH